MKSVVISFVVATAVAIFGPRSLTDVGAHVTRAGILMLQLGLALDPPRASDDWYDPGEGDVPMPYLEEARAAFPEPRA